MRMKHLFWLKQNEKICRLSSFSGIGQLGWPTIRIISFILIHTSDKAQHFLPVAREQIYCIYILAKNLDIRIPNWSLLHFVVFSNRHQRRSDETINEEYASSLYVRQQIFVWCVSMGLKKKKKLNILEYDQDHLTTLWYIDHHSPESYRLTD